MKTFSFPLERVMNWRHTLTQMEEVKLEALRSHSRELGEQAESIERERRAAGRKLVCNGGATGLELELLDAFQKAADAELARLDRARAECSRLIAEQTSIVAERRRDARLLEKLKERKLQTWKHALTRDLQNQADEASLARFTA